MIQKHFDGYHKALSKLEKSRLYIAAGQQFGKNPDSMRQKLTARPVKEDQHILWAVEWVRKNCPLKCQAVDEQLSHDQTTEDRLNKFHRDVIEGRESNVEQLAEINS